MKIAEIIQACLLSGALGYISLTQLQNQNAVSAYISKVDANYQRVIFGVLDYLIYLVVHLLVGAGLNGWILKSVRIGQMKEQVVVVVSAITTAILVWIGIHIYGVWRKRAKTPGGFQIMSSREQGFADPGEGGALRVDIFKLDGSFVASGYLAAYDADQDLQGDVLLHPLGKYDKLVETEEQVIAAKLFGDLYLDMKNGLKYYVTPTALATS
jgi:hypothetical protein